MQIFHIPHFPYLIVLISHISHLFSPSSWEVSLKTLILGGEEFLQGISLIFLHVAPQAMDIGMQQQLGAYMGFL